MPKPILPIPLDDRLSQLCNRIERCRRCDRSASGACAAHVIDYLIVKNKPAWFRDWCQNIATIRRERHAGTVQTAEA